jgi:L-fuculose-phosphate aldolase
VNRYDRGVNELARQLCDIGRRAYQRGLIAAAEGNFSSRIDDATILCTPTGMCKGFLTPDDLCVIDPAGRQVSGARRPSSEIKLHLAAYDADPRVRAVVHTHPPFATTLAVLGETIPAGVLPEAEILLGPVPLVPYCTPGTAALGEALRPFVRDHVAAILQNHGAVTWADDLERAYQWTEVLEAVCRVVYQARRIGMITPIPPNQLGELPRRRPCAPGGA